MRRSLVLPTLVSFLVGHAATAQVVTLLHEGKPALSVSYPNGWQIRTPGTEGVNLISAVPADGSVLWQGMWLVRDVTTVEQAVERLVNLPGRLFSDIKQSREPSQEQIGDLAVYKLRGTGTYKETEPVEFHIYLFEAPDQRIGAMAYMGKLTAIERHRGDLEAMLQSLSAFGT